MPTPCCAPAVRRLVAAAALAVGVLLATTTAAAALPRYDGVQVHYWSDTSDGDMTRDLDLAKMAGSNVVRLDIGWQSLESAGKGQYSQWYIDRLDRFFAAARARGLKVVGMLWLTPCWASSAPDALKQGCGGDWWSRNVGLYPPSNAQDYADVARWVTSRYAADLAALEVWNEPNDDRYLASSDNAGDYASLVRAAYPAAKQGNAGVPVLAGAIEYSDRPFLNQLYMHGIKGSYDGISVHAYAPGIAPTASSPDRSHAFRDGLTWMREGQQAVGDATPIWVTEFGWSTCSGNGACVSEAQQASYTYDAFSVLQSMPFVQAAVVYNLREKGGDQASQEDKWGVVRPDFSPKPGFTALRSALTGGPAPPAPPATGPATARAPAATPGSATNRATTSGPAARRTARLSVKVVRKGKTAYAAGAGPARSRVTLRISSCRVPKRTRAAAIGSNGRFRHKLGAVKRFRGCRVKASASGLATTASVRV